jgi:hypothetical protein
MLNEELYTDSMPFNGYSIDFLIKTIFEYELKNHLTIKHIEGNDNETNVVITYFEQRIKEIKENYL